MWTLLSKDSAFVTLFSPFSFTPILEFDINDFILSSPTLLELGMSQQAHGTLELREETMLVEGVSRERSMGHAMYMKTHRSLLKDVVFIKTLNNVLNET